MFPFRNRSHRELGQLSSLTLLAFGLRLYRLGERSFWYDELLQLDIVQGPLAHIWPQLEQHSAMPLDYYLLHGWIQLGRQETWVRFPAACFGTLAIPLIYLLTRRLFNHQTGLWAAILLTFSSFAVQYSQEARPYALLLTLTLISYLGLWQLYQTHKHRYWFLIGAGIIGAIMTHYFALFILLPMGLFVIGHQWYHLKEKRFWSHTASFILLLLMVLFLFTLTGRFWRLYSVGYGFASASVSPHKLTLPAPEKPNRGSGPPLEQEFLLKNMWIPLSTAHPIPLLMYGLFIVITTLMIVADPHKKAILLLQGWLFLPPLLIYLFLLQRGTFFAIRYILYTLPAFLILTAYGLITLGRLLSKQKLHLKNSFIILLIIPLLGAEGQELWANYTANSHEDWRAVGQILYHHAQPEDVIIAVHAEPAINWYYPPATTPFRTYDRTETIWAAINQHSRRWFIISSYSYKRTENLREWLHNNGAVTITIDRRVTVYLQQEGLTQEDLLVQVKDFTLPPNPLTYLILAQQMEEQGDLKTAQIFIQEARKLTENRNFTTKKGGDEGNFIGE